MKLMNREPTEEMVKAAYTNYVDKGYTGYISTFQAMYDAAPEIATNSDYSAEQVATLQAEIEHHRKTAANRLIGLCKCGEEKDALLKAIQNVKDVKGRYHTERAMLAMFKLLEKE